MSILDVAIIGAGISGINTAYRLQEAQPDIKYSIFEARDVIGGTWSLFTYPGIRSDSDLFTFGFEWNPWYANEILAGADAIMEYLDQSLKLFGGDDHLEFGQKLVSLDWSSKEKLWSLNFANGRKEKARWVVLGTGYYDYKNALPAEIPGINNFAGQVVHPQFWPKDLDLENKRVAIIGSGATAITILPNIVDRAQSVTLVQRSPSYIGSIPRTDSQAPFLKKWLPFSWAMTILRLKHLLVTFLFIWFCKTFPNRARKIILNETKKALPPSIPVDPHFSPSYKLWDQRFCMCPDGDFYAALRSGKGHIVTGHIETIKENSIVIRDQPESTIEADVIITATGLKILTGGCAVVSIDGRAVNLPDKMVWKACMIQDIPNLINIVGYTNNSWTPGADVTAKHFTRLRKRMKDAGYTVASPVASVSVKAQPFMKMSSTYLLKGRGQMPSGGDQYPWLPRKNYFLDMFDARFGDLSKDMVFA